MVLRRKSNSGQVAILFALVFTFMFILFAFVVNFGEIVNNKINLQNAADAAAYTGAAWQARILNEISQVNYHMRQDIKELAMRLNVTHTRHNRNFPRGRGLMSGGHQRPQQGYQPFVCQQAHGYRAISGLTYANDTNLCRNAAAEVGGLPPIVVPPVIAAFDPFAVAIAAQIRRIQEKADQECKAAADDNRQLVQHLIQVYSRRLRFHSDQIKALSGYLNEVANENLGPGAQHPIVKAAYESAFRNLTVSNRENIQMEILQPEGNEYLRLEESQMRASVFYYDFNVVGSGCVARARFLPADDLSAGFSKARSIVTFFSVKLSAQPQLMFAPARWAEAAFPSLQAISAAKPFGSRIGPESTIDQLMPVSGRPGNTSQFINFSFKPNDSIGIMSTKLMAYLDGLHNFNGVPRPDGNQTTGWPEPAKTQGRTALQAIRAPTIFDALFYSIHPAPGGNINNDYLEPEYAQALFPDYMEAANADNTIVDTRQPATAPYFPQTVGSRNKGNGWIQINANNTGAGGPYSGYGEESLGTHSVVGSAALPDIQGKEAEFGWATKEILHSGWAPDGRPGRIGYSVKFIPLNGLTRSIFIRLDQTGRQGNIANPPTGDPNLPKIFH